MASSLRLADGLSREYLLHHRVCPKEFVADDRLLVAATEDAILDAIDEIGFAYSCEVVVEPATMPELERLVERIATRTERLIELATPDHTESELTADVRDLANQPPVIRYVNLIVRDAYEAAASDVHLELGTNGPTARFRLDGLLVPAPEPPANLYQAVVSRIKLLAELDIAERRKPQDGRIRVRLEERDLDVRVSAVPTMFGESIVLRLLDRGGRPVGLEEIGMSKSVLETMAAAAARPHGMILATGPTGSGKTTTLYAALGRRDAIAEKIMTVEDPIEYQLPGTTQVPVHRQAGVSFGSALRSILRQDPDVIMIGEMRDPETAEIAVQAAMTGHLVFSTLHTNDAVSALPRLLDLGIPPYLVSATLEAVLAQRLVRRICSSCRVAYRPPPEALLRFSEENVSCDFVRGSGCAKCRGTGFRGRVGIFELLTITEHMRDAISRGTPASVLRSLAVEAGMKPMRQDGWSKIEAGLTTVEEVLRVVQN